jgi:hypothetical protein
MIKQYCACCNKKLGYTGIACRCVNADNIPNVFCDICRIPRTKYSENGHNCDFDYKKMGREIIEKNNPIITGFKIENI